jgi:hypothetical protein
MHTEIRLEQRMTSKTNHHAMLLRRRCNARWTQAGTRFPFGSIAICAVLVSKSLSRCFMHLVKASAFFRWQTTHSAMDAAVAQAHSFPGQKGKKTCLTSESGFHFDPVWSSALTSSFVHPHRSRILRPLILSGPALVLGCGTMFSGIVEGEGHPGGQEDLSELTLAHPLRAVVAEPEPENDPDASCPGHSSALRHSRLVCSDASLRPGAQLPAQLALTDTAVRAKLLALALELPRLGVTEEAARLLATVDPRFAQGPDSELRATPARAFSLGAQGSSARPNAQAGQVPCPFHPFHHNLCSFFHADAVRYRTAVHAGTVRCGIRSESLCSPHCSRCAAVSHSHAEARGAGERRRQRSGAAALGRL